MVISIVIPVYNVESYIVECLESVANQDYNDIECIIVDDCGTDNSIGLCQKFIKGYVGKIDFKVIRHKINSGLSEARNTGLRHCHGDYVLFLDSDDWLKRNAINTLVAPLKDKMYDFVIGDFDVSEGINIYPKLFLNEGNVSGDNVFQSYSKSQWYMMAWNKLCRRDFLMDNQLFFEPGILHEDDLWSFLLAMSARTFYVKKKVTYCYRVREGSIMQAKAYDWKRHHSSYLMVVRKMVERYKKNASCNSKILDYIMTFTERHVFYNHQINVYIKYKEYKDCSSLFKAYRKGFSKLYIKSKLRHLHYLLPSVLGFSVFLLAFKLKNK